MSRSSASAAIATLGIDPDKNSFHLVGQEERGAIVLRIELSRIQLSQRLANTLPCLIGMEACAGAHHIGRQLQALGHDVRLIPAQYVKPFLKGHKNDYRDAEAIAEAVQRPTISFVATKTPEQMELLALHRVRSRLVGQRTGVTNQIRGLKYLRTLFVQAAHIVLVRRLLGARLGLWTWIETAGRRLHRNMLVVALANKLARIAWAVLARGQGYQPRSASHPI